MAVICAINATEVFTMEYSVLLFSAIFIAPLLFTASIFLGYFFRYAVHDTEFFDIRRAFYQHNLFHFSGVNVLKSRNLLPIADARLNDWLLIFPVI